MGPINPHVAERVAAIRRQLLAARDAGRLMSAATKGVERETVVDGFLSRVLPPTYRFGTGDATDVAGNRSGQLDVVVEYPFGPSIPSIGNGTVRLYLAETVGVVIEVKSDLAGQWSEVARTASQLSIVSRAPHSGLTWGPGPPSYIPLVVFGFSGWKTIATLRERVESTAGVHAALSLEENLFYWKGRGHITGETALWGLVCFLHEAMASLISGSGDPFPYIGLVEDSKSET